MRHSALQLAVVLGLGASLGYLAAVGLLDASPAALASEQPALTSTTGDPPRACEVRCSEGLSRQSMLSTLSTGLVTASAPTAQEGKKPNIVIIWGDDIGQSNISAYSHGLMGYQTPNIDRIAREGMMFTDYYGEQSCTAGRASFITGQHGLDQGWASGGHVGTSERRCNDCRHDQNLWLYYGPVR